MEKLTDEQINAALNELEGWETQEDFITKSFEFENFAEALSFVNRVGEIAEKADHHPDIMFGWGYAEIALTTHDAGGVTEKDFELARQIEALENA